MSDELAYNILEHERERERERDKTYTETREGGERCVRERDE